MPEHDHSRRRHLKFRYDRGSWLMQGLPQDTGIRFDHLAEAVEYAKAECAAEPAWIEMIVSDFHVMAHQETGWSRPLCCPSSQRSAASATWHAKSTANLVD